MISHYKIIGWLDKHIFYCPSSVIFCANFSFSLIVQWSSSEERVKICSYRHAPTHLGVIGHQGIMRKRPLNELNQSLPSLLAWMANLKTDIEWLINVKLWESKLDDWLFIILMQRSNIKQVQVLGPLRWAFFVMDKSKTLWSNLAISKCIISSVPFLFSS